VTFRHHEARRALNNSIFNSTVRLLWRVMVDYCDEDGRCWPSVETLALDVGVSERHAQRALRDLETRGLVSTERRTGRVSTYTLTPDASVTGTPDAHVTRPLTPASPGGDAHVTRPLTPASPHTGIDQGTIQGGGEWKGEREPSPSPPADYTDSDAETVIPLDLVDRAKAAGVLTQLADGLGQPLMSIEAKAREFVAFWSIGGGAGKRRRHWMARLRRDIHEAHKRNQLTPPGAIEHRDGSQSGRAMSPAVAAFLAGGRGSA